MQVVMGMHHHSPLGTSALPDRCHHAATPYSCHQYEPSLHLMSGNGSVHAMAWSYSLGCLKCWHAPVVVRQYGHAMQRGA